MQVSSVLALRVKLVSFLDEWVKRLSEWPTTIILAPVGLNCFVRLGENARTYLNC